MPIKRVASFTIGSLLLARAVSGAILDIQPAQLPDEIKSITAVTIKADGRRFVFSGSDRSGRCVVAVTTRELVLTARRSFPSFPTDGCAISAIDSMGNILVYGRSQSPEFLFTSELVPGEVSNDFFMKLSCDSLATIYSVKVRLGAVLDVAVASDDSIWLGGYALRGLPTTPDAIWRDYHDSPYSTRERAGFVARLSADARKVLYCTYLGGYRDAVGAISIDRDDNVYAAGSQMWKLSPSGRLIWSTWLPPSSALSSAIGPDGSFYVVGSTGLGENLYTTPNAFQANPLPNQSFQSPPNNRSYPATSIDGFAARISPDGRVIYSTLMGGRGEDKLSKVFIVADGSAIVYGSSSSSLFPTRAAITMNPGGRSVVAKLSPNGDSVAYSTYTLQGLSAPVVHPDGGLFMILSSAEAEIFGFRVRENPAELPRIDAVLRSSRPGDSLVAGTSATISGEGFLAVTSVQVGTVTSRILQQSDTVIEIELPTDLPGLASSGFFSAFSGNIVLLKDGEPVQQIHVMVSPPPQP